ncbi:MAG: PASTA domain-containing protein [Paludibacter sp.]|jgi:beta-lactam-binding protein with PASTA domain
MNFKKFWKETFAGLILKNVLIAIALIVSLSWGTLLIIDFYTHHGQTERVPDLRGSTLNEAKALLSNQSLHAQVIDSVYVRNKKLGTIIDQIPGPNSSVKSNRSIYLIINSSQVRQVTLPDVTDISYRQAIAMLQSIGLNFGSVEYTPSEYKDLVTDVKFKGRSLMPGTRLPEGSTIVLVVGSGNAGSPTVVPALKGMSLEDATVEVQKVALKIGNIDYDVPPSGNENDYIIYRQIPAAGSTLPAGSNVDIYLSTNKSRVNEIFDEDKKPKETDEVFF